MRVIVIGAAGNVGTSFLRPLENEDQVESILGLCDNVRPQEQQNGSTHLFSSLSFAHP